MQTGNRTESEAYKMLRKIVRFLYIFAGAPISLQKDGRLAIHPVKKWIEILVTTSVLSMEIYIQALRQYPSQRNMYLLLADGREFIKVGYMLCCVVDLNLHLADIKKLFDLAKEIDETLQLVDKKEKEFKWKLTFWVVTLSVTSVSFVTLKQFREYRNWLQNTFLILLNIRLFCQRILGEILFSSLALFLGCQLDTLAGEIIGWGESGEFSRLAFSDKVCQNGERCRHGKVGELRSLYRLIHKLKTEMNDVFSFRLFLAVVYTFSEMLFFTFADIVFFQTWVDEKSPQNFSPPFLFRHWVAQLILMNGWLTFLILKFLQVISTCNGVAEKSKHIAVAIHESRSSPSCTQPIKDELLAFSAEVATRDPYFVACKLFRIHYPLVSSVVGATVMHIIILLQFQQSEQDGESVPIRDILMRA